MLDLVLGSKMRGFIAIYDVLLYLNCCILQMTGF